MFFKIKKTFLKNTFKKAIAQSPFLQVFKTPPRRARGTRARRGINRALFYILTRL